MSLVFALMLGWTVVGDAEPMSPVAFRDRLAASVASATGRPTEPIDDRTFKANRADGTELTLSIDNAYNEYLAHPEAKDAVINRYVRLLVTESPGSISINDLIVIVRPNDYLTKNLPSGASTANFITPRPVAGDLSFFLAIDSPETIRLAGPADLAQLKIDEATAWQRARANVKQRVGPLALTRLGGSEGAVGLSADSGLGPSILTDPELCGPSAPNGMNSQIVLVYARDMFLFANPEDKAMTMQFWQTVRRETAAGRSMSMTPITCVQGKWQQAKAP